ncbi:MAG: hypothetical protein HUN05_17770 [Desulfobacter sp.]|nr:MAG: hypothetical protein HUN05_17770 [Desulfobacter sp.]
MDSLSGVPFFLHIFSYFGVYMIVQLLKQFVFQRNLVFMMVISLISVAIHQGLILFSIFVSNGQEGVLTLDFSLMLRQLIWGVLFIPPGIWGMNLMRQNFVYFARQIRRELERKYRG